MMNANNGGVQNIHGSDTQATTAPSTVVSKRAAVIDTLTAILHDSDTQAQAYVQGFIAPASGE